MKDRNMVKKIKLSFVDALFGLENSESSVQIRVDEIRSFKDHPFKVIEDEKMVELVESIKLNGVLSPVLLREDGKKGYEMISGHRRLHAAKLAGLTKVPAIVRDMTDEEATIVMVDSNIQREELLPSEKAFALKMKMEAMKRQAGRPKESKSDFASDGGKNDVDENSTQNGRDFSRGDVLANNSAQNERNLETADFVGEECGMSRAQVRRYIRLTYLIPELLDLVDKKRLQFTIAVDISYFDKTIQKWLNEYIRENVVIKPIQIAALKEHVAKENIDQSMMISFLRGAMPGKPSVKKVVMNENKLKKYFPEDYTNSQMERVIEALLEQWSNGRKEGAKDGI